MTKYLILFSFLLLNKPLWAQNTITLRIDPDNAHGGTAAQVFDSIRFIPLETTKESLFGSIDQLEVTDSLFIILDIRRRSILLFKRNGKFHAKITTGGVDKYLYYFTLDLVNHQIIATNNYANGLLVYDFDAKFLRKEPCPDEISSFYRFPNNTILYNLRRHAQCEPADHIRFDLCYSKGYNEVTNYLKPYNARNEAGDYNGDCNPLNFSGAPGSCMFSIPFEYSIYQLNDTGILRKYQLIFPLRYSLPLNFASDPMFRNTRAKFVYGPLTSPSKISALERAYRLGDYLLFAIVDGRLTIGSDRIYAYNLKNNNLISFSRVSGDSSSFYFPILSSVLEQINAIYDDQIFSSMPSFRVFAIKNNLDKKVTYTDALQEYLATGKRTDNPVIIQFRLKPNL